MELELSRFFDRDDGGGGGVVGVILPDRDVEKVSRDGSVVEAAGQK